MDLERQCRELFEAHRQSAFDGTFHVPSLGRYRGLFAWDSGYHALALRHLEQVSSQEVAQILGIEESSASKRHLRALKRLGKIFRDFGGSRVR